MDLMTVEFKNNDSSQVNRANGPSRAYIIIFLIVLSLMYQDPTNLQGKNQKHQAFEAELNANQSRLDAVDNTGEQLISDEHYASDQIRERLDELHKLWAHLFDKSKDKG